MGFGAMGCPPRWSSLLVQHGQPISEPIFGRQEAVLWQGVRPATARAQPALGGVEVQDHLGPRPQIARVAGAVQVVSREVAR